MTNFLLEPHLAECRCGFSFPCSSPEEKERRERVHAERVHNSTVAAVTGLVTADPIHERDVAEVVAAIELDAKANAGEVDPSRVRLLLGSHIQPQVIGAVYSQLIRQRRLRECGWTTNTDRRGRNAGRPIRLYEMQETA